VHTLRFFYIDEATRRPRNDLTYSGWKNLWATVPGSVRQDRRTEPSHANLRFVKFRIWTQPTERVGDFYLFFKQLKTLTDTFESMFDGDQLADPDLLPGLWSGGNASAATEK